MSFHFFFVVVHFWMVVNDFSNICLAPTKRKFLHCWWKYTYMAVWGHSEPGMDAPPCGENGLPCLLGPVKYHLWPSPPCTVEMLETVGQNRKRTQWTMTCFRRITICTLAQLFFCCFTRPAHLCFALLCLQIFFLTHPYLLHRKSKLRNYNHTKTTF